MSTLKWINHSDSPLNLRVHTEFIQDQAGLKLKWKLENFEMDDHAYLPSIGVNAKLHIFGMAHPKEPDQRWEDPEIPQRLVRLKLRQQLSLPETFLLTGIS